LGPVVEAEHAGVDALRAGAQYALPLERLSVIARAGVARLTEAGLRTASVAGAPLAGSAPGRTRLTAGAGAAFEKITLDLAYDGAGGWSVEIRLAMVVTLVERTARCGVRLRHRCADYLVRHSRA
jgi:hypothetical protein